MTERRKLPFIVGATATGKSDLAVETARLIGCAEIVTADSVQIYRRMNIGSAKPTSDEMMGIPHRMIDIADVFDADFSAAKYRDMALETIRDAFSRNVLPIVAGGTGLYINSLTYPLSFQSIPPNRKLRDELAQRERSNSGALMDMLSILNPAAAQRLHKNDTKRIVRAIEIALFEQNGSAEAEDDFLNERGEETEFDPVMIGIRYERELLYDRINARVDRMMERGLLGEVKELVNDGACDKLPAMKALGYRQLAQYLNAETTLEEAVEKIKLETRHFAKRQETWFKRDKRIVWLCAESFDCVKTMAQKAYEIFKERGVF